MKATVSLTQVYYNPEFGKQLFRKQAYETFEKVMQESGATTSESLFDKLENAINVYYDYDLDLFEEDCYNREYNEILEEIGYEI